MDLTGLKQLDAAQQKTLNILQKITMQGSEVVYQFRLRPDGSTCVPYVSDAISEIYRLSPEELREDASKVFSVVHPDDLDGHMDSIRASAQYLIPWLNEYRVKFDDGTVRWLSGNGLPQRETDGSIFWHGFIIDITERKKSEERRWRCEEKLRAYLDNISDTIWLIDANLNIAYVSQGVAHLLGVLPEELIGRPSVQVIHPDDIGITTNAMRYVMESPSEPLTIQYRVSHKDGRWIHVESTGVNMQDNPAINGVLITMRDATERLQAEASVRAEQEVQASRATVSKVRKIAAHMEKLRESERKHIAREVHDELGQILSVLRMDIALLKDRTGINNAVMDGIERNMLTLVDRAIQGVRNIASSLRPVQLDMGSVAAIEWQCTEFAKHSGIPCLLKVAGDITGLDEQRALAIFRIVQESLTNVARHAGATRVEISIATRNGAIEMEIRDNGRGFAPEEPIGYESFGLLGMRERAISIGGELNVTGRPGQGTVVALRIPDDPAEEKEPFHPDRRYGYRRIR